MGSGSTTAYPLELDVSPGGVRVNVVMKDGGNSFNGTFFGAWNDGAWQSDNLTDGLKAKGLRAADRIAKIYEFSGGFGGPVKRDKVWFWYSTRLNRRNVSVRPGLGRAAARLSSADSK